MPPSVLPAGHPEGSGKAGSGPRQPREWIWIAGAFLALGLAIALLALAVVQRQLPPTSFSTPPPASKSRPSSPTFLRGVYQSMIMRPGRDGISRIDSKATIAALAAAGVNTFAYLICPDPAGNPAVSQTQWQDLPEFANLAATSGIEVYVYLVPPTEAAERAYLPFHWNYVGWASAIGRLAVTYPAIKGIVIDDFAQNTIAERRISFYFTPSYVARMTAAARVYAPRLVILPVLYYRDLVGPAAVLSRFRTVISGVVFPYSGAPLNWLRPANTVDASQALSQGGDVAELVHCPAASGCSLVAFAEDGSTNPGAAATAHAALSPLPGVPQALSVEAKDDRGLGGTGRHRVDVFVNGRLLESWTPAAGRTRHTFDLTRMTRGHHAVDVAMRIWRPSHVPAGSSIMLSELALTGFSGSENLTLPQLHGLLGATVTPAPDLSLIYMTYAAPLTAEQGHGAAPQYVHAVLTAVDVLRKRGELQGSLIFNVRLPGSSGRADPRNYAVVQDFYRRWARE
jgi:hypothetical protein